MEFAAAIVSAVSTGFFAGDIWAGVSVGVVTFAILILATYAVNCILAPFRLNTELLNRTRKLGLENSRLAQEISNLRKPRFVIDIPKFNLSESADHKLLCATVIRVSNCGIIPSTLDEWQAKIILASGEEIEIPTIWVERWQLWGPGKQPGVGPPDLVVTSDQFIYERVANTPVAPGHKVSGYLIGAAPIALNLDARYFDKATFVVEAIDSASERQSSKFVIDMDNFNSADIYVPGLTSATKQV